VALAGPLSVSVTVKGIVSPTLGRALLTTLTRARSACWGLTEAVPLLLAGVGSNWSEGLTLAGLALGCGLVARGGWGEVGAGAGGVVGGVGGGGGLAVARVEIVVVVVYVPGVGGAEARARPAGSVSCTATLVAGSGPALVSVMV